jgi:tRNA (adenine58-N1)-methyltransferase non-catalytic subunit
MVNLGKFGSFLADELVNQPYGLTYEVVNKTISVIPPPAVHELGKRGSLFPRLPSDDMDTEDTDATNELINDGQFVQPLTAAEIEALKQSGVHATVTIHIPPFALDMMELRKSRKSSGNR